MPTILHLLSDQKLTIDREPDQVTEDIAAAHGAAVRLPQKGNAAELYVSPAAIAYWHAVPPLDLENYRMEQL